MSFTKNYEIVASVNRHVTLPKHCIPQPKVDSQTIYWLKNSWKDLISNESIGYKKALKEMEKDLKQKKDFVENYRSRSPSDIASPSCVNSQTHQNSPGSPTATSLKNVSPLSLLMDMFFRNVGSLEPQTRYFTDPLSVHKKSHMFAELMKFIIISSENLDQIQTNITIKALAKSHIRVGVTSETLDVFFIIIPDMLKSILGHNYFHLEEIIVAWMNAFSSVVLIWCQGLLDEALSVNTLVPVSTSSGCNCVVQ